MSASAATLIDLITGDRGEEEELLADHVMNDSGNCSSRFNSFNNSKSNHDDSNIIINDDDEAYTDDKLTISNRELDLDLQVDTSGRTLRNLLLLEDYYRPESNYFLYVQHEIKPWMRKMLANWMLDVCKSHSKEEDVFVLAMNMLDRFLCQQRIGKRHLQLLGTVCMFIAAKLRSSSQFNVEALAIYTDNSISIQELLDCEQIVLQKLKWDISSVTPFDYFPILVESLNLTNTSNFDEMRRNFENFVWQCAKDIKFSLIPTSVIASGCLLLALKLSSKASKKDLQHTLFTLHSLTNEFVQLECLVQCLEQIEDMIRSELKIDLTPNSISTTTTTKRVLTSSNTNILNTTTSSMDSSKSASKMYHEKSSSVNKENRHVWVN